MKLPFLAVQSALHLVLCIPHALGELRLFFFFFCHKECGGGWGSICGGHCIWLEELGFNVISEVADSDKKKGNVTMQ